MLSHTSGTYAFDAIAQAKRAFEIDGRPAVYDVRKWRFGTDWETGYERGMPKPVCVTVGPRPDEDREMWELVEDRALLEELTGLVRAALHAGYDAERVDR